MTDQTPLEHWNGRYVKEGYLFGEEPNAFLKSQAHRLAPGQRALALADGEGRNGVFLAGEGLDVLSVDFSPVALEKARRLAARKGVALETRTVDLYRWEFEEAAFDVVAAIFIQFAPPPERARIFDGIKRALKPGGLLIMQGYRPKQVEYKTGGPPQAENMYTEDLLREAFGEFEILHLEEHDDVIEEGSGHSGLSALIDLVARKPASPSG